MTNELRIVLGYLEKNSGATDIPSEEKSKEDKGKQTAAVEKLVRETISKKMPEWADKVFSVGGFVRDRLLGKNPKDLDLVVDDSEKKIESAEIFAKEFTNAIGLTGENNPHPLKATYGIWGIALLNPRGPDGKRKPYVYDGVDVSGYVIELTPPRREGPYDEKKREPAYVEYTSRDDDAKRRDLTVNAIYQNIVTGKIEDYVNGLGDLKDKHLRPPEHPDGIEKIYEDDPLRLFRLVRFNGKLPGFKISPEIVEVVKNFIKSPRGHKFITSKVAKDRIRDEFESILTHPDGKAAAQGLDLLKDYDLLKHVSPHLDKMIEVFHDRVYHSGESVWQHTLEVIEKTPPSRLARLGALFHDIGKIDTAEEKIDKQGRPRVHFENHENQSAVLIPQVMRELHFSNEDIKSVTNIAHAHMGFRDFDKMRSGKKLTRLRLFIEKLHKDVDDALALIRADMSRDPEFLPVINELEQLIKKQREEDINKGILQTRNKNPEYVAPLTGDEIEQEFGVEGEQIGLLKNKLKEWLLNGTFDKVPDHQKAERAKKKIQKFIHNTGTYENEIKKYKKLKTDRNFYKVK